MTVYIRVTVEEASSLVFAVGMLLPVAVQVYWRSVVQKLQPWRMVNKQPHEFQHRLLLQRGWLVDCCSLPEVSP